MKPPVNVDIQATAKAELSIKGEIPKKTMGRIFESIVDIFSPFTEARGLRGDQIRLMREDVAYEIALRAKERLRIEQQEAHPVDNKILLPLIEKCSLEAPENDEMLERWSALLANAAASNKVQPRFVQILSEIATSQAALFEKIMLNDPTKYPDPDSTFDDASLNLSDSDIRFKIKHTLVEESSREDTDALFQKLVNLIDFPGCAIVDVIYHSNDDFISCSLDGDLANENRGIDLEILSSLGLLRYIHIETETDLNEDIEFYYYHVTDLGVAFFRSVDRRLRKPAVT